MEQRDSTAKDILFEAMILEYRNGQFQEWLTAIGQDSYAYQSKLTAYTAAYANVVAYAVNEVDISGWRNAVLSGSLESILIFLNEKTPPEEERLYEEDTLDDLDEMAIQIAESWSTSHLSYPLAQAVVKKGLSAPLIIHASFVLTMYRDLNQSHR